MRAWVAGATLAVVAVTGALLEGMAPVEATAAHKTGFHTHTKVEGRYREVVVHYYLQDGSGKYAPNETFRVPKRCKVRVWEDGSATASCRSV